jgi:hypothetical protein
MNPSVVLRGGHVLQIEPLKKVNETGCSFLMVHHK